MFENHFNDCLRLYGRTSFQVDFSKSIWSSTYKAQEDQDIDHTFYRVASTVASIEKDSQLWTERFYDLFVGFKACPGGRILSNAGAKWDGTSWFNCFVGTKPDVDQDSIEGIYQTLIAQAQTLKSEGGWGMNFSFIRPRGAFIHGIGSSTPGAVKFMELFDKSSEIITEGSGVTSKSKKGKEKIRKGAQMSTLDCWHPDVEEFITAKQTEGRLTKFNMSVNCVNEFMDLVVKLTEMRKSGASKTEIDELDKWDLVFPDTTHEKYKQEWDGDIQTWKEKGYPVVVYRTVSALDLFDKIITSTYNRSEPGVQFLDRANETYLFNYSGVKIKASNPCGEQTMPFSSACDLASINLTQFVSGNGFDLKNLGRCVGYAVRFLDNVNSLSPTPLPEYTEAVTKRRRIGLGVMGWGSALFMLKVRYGSKKAENLKDELMKTFVYSAVGASIDLAEEKGMFEGCDPEQLAKHKYWDMIDLPTELRERMRKFGMRNSSLFSIQPTGNTGILCNNVSGGLEPIFLPSYIRTVIVPNCPSDMVDVVPKYWQGEFHETEAFKFSKEGDEVILTGEFNGVLYKIDKNRGLTKEEPCTDYGVSHLIERGEWDPNAEWAVTTASLAVEDHITDMTGWCKWIDASCSKTVNVPNDYPFDSFKGVYLNAYKSGVIKGITTYRAGTMTSVLKSVDAKEEKSENSIHYTHAPKRPKELECDIVTTTVEGQKWTVFVGLMNNRPYEIFGGLSEQIVLPRKYKTGFIKKHKISRSETSYDLYVGEVDDPIVIKNVVKTFRDDNMAWATRILSTSLRHGVPVNFIVEQLQREAKDGLHSFSKAIARVLKKYIEDDTKSGENCANCGEKLIFREGCSLCLSCGLSKCG